ncbi:hypothetical protein AWH48_00255 [Domibacillus aminovorans]|uniref:Uncharacterized protein n=1 Tax=Domibacillus aminovorans TaxID=29332 RepID=A0A177L2E8_9BACI|nr:hypothetical protein AWH48_00255 [Domibacillus aminovorans]
MERKNVYFSIGWFRALSYKKGTACYFLILIFVHHAQQFFFKAKILSKNTQLLHIMKGCMLHVYHKLFEYLKFNFGKRLKNSRLNSEMSCI